VVSVINLENFKIDLRPLTFYFTKLTFFLSYFKDNLLGSFYLTLYTDKQPEICKYVARHIHYNKEIFTEAYKAVEFLGTNYYAIHIRRNDFQYKDLFLSAEQIYNNIKNVVPEGAKLYISTDEKDKTFFNLLAEHYKLYFYDVIYYYNLTLRSIVKLP
jgi:hypothetical protein